ncbi:hypothetical protein BGX34_007432 [Mortierella sp. NVP85]|nr:hypothetical protein BGX34_007432 [Mortierella sp. NVP85]
MSSRISTVAYYASLSRLAIWVVAVVSHALIQDYDSSLELVLPIQTPSQQLFKSVFGVFLRWDSFYFTHTAKNGYAFEQAHAFFPLLSMLMRLVASTALRISFALALAAALTAQAAPILPNQAGDIPESTCSQNVDSGEVSIASTINTVPVTNVTPINRYQPIIQTFAPIVDSQCDFNPLFDTSIADISNPGAGIGLNIGGAVGGAQNLLGLGMDTSNLPCLGALAGMTPNIANNLPGLGMDASNLAVGARPMLRRRQLEPATNPGASTTAPSDVACQTSIPPQTVGMGSSVTMVPSTAVSPSTVYQAAVQSLESNIDAAPAQSSALPQQNVDLGSNVSIQPTTQVIPQTTYQPAVQQLTTDIQATPQQDQSLPQSSVQLGSSVQITPTVSVRPLTIFQPSIQSLPFIIDVAPCPQDFQRGFPPSPAGILPTPGQGLGAPGQDLSTAPLGQGPIGTALGQGFNFAASGQGLAAAPGQRFDTAALGQGLAAAASDPSFGTAALGQGPVGAAPGQGFDPAALGQGSAGAASGQSFGTAALGQGPVGTAPGQSIGAVGYPGASACGCH